MTGNGAQSYYLVVDSTEEQLYTEEAYSLWDGIKNPNDYNHIEDVPI